MDNDRIDFSALDPKRNSRRFEKMVETVIAGARPHEPGISPLIRELVAWGRGAVALAALLAVTAWLPALIRDSFRAAESAPATGNDFVELVSSWARTGDVPSEVDVSQALGEVYGR